MGKYGQRNHVKLDPLSYSICLLGESKIGKTSLMKEVCEKLAGDDSYLFLEMYREHGADAIEGIVAENVPDWETYEDIISDIVDNKTVDYPNLRAIIIDTYDQYISLAEQESIALWNRQNPDKKTDSINGAWGGFGRGEKKAIELMFEKLDELYSVGVTPIIIGHCKLKDVADVTTGETYQVLTSDQQQNYFNALKKNLHILALAYIDRTIVKVKASEKKDITGKIPMKSVVSGQARKIKFRDDLFSIDSGSRFADLPAEVDFSADAFINAIESAIKSEQQKNKNGISLEEEKKKQDADAAEALRKIAQAEEKKKEEKKIDEVKASIMEFIQTHKEDVALIGKIVSVCRDNGYKNPTEIKDMETAQQIFEMCK